MSRTHKIQRSHEYHAALKSNRSDVEPFQDNNLLDYNLPVSYRYGNQRKMRANADVKQRRADKRNLPRPIEDIYGDLGLETRAMSPSRSRGRRWR